MASNALHKYINRECKLYPESNIDKFGKWSYLFIIFYMCYARSRDQMQTRWMQKSLFSQANVKSQVIRYMTVQDKRQKGS